MSCSESQAAQFFLHTIQFSIAKFATSWFDTNKVLAMPEVKNRFESEGVLPKGGSTEYFDKFIRSEIVKYEQVIKKANIERQ